MSDKTNKAKSKEDHFAHMTSDGLVIVKGDITKKIRNSPPGTKFTFTEALAEMN